VADVVDISTALTEAETKRKEAGALRRLLASEEYGLYAAYIDQIANKYIGQLLGPGQREWEAHYLRGIIKGLDMAKTLPRQVVDLYDSELKQESGQPANPAEPGLRACPEPEETDA